MTVFEQEWKQWKHESYKYYRWKLLRGLSVAKALMSKASLPLQLQSFKFVPTMQGLLCLVSWDKKFYHSSGINKYFDRFNCIVIHKFKFPLSIIHVNSKVTVQTAWHPFHWCPTWGYVDIPHYHCPNTLWRSNTSYCWVKTLDKILCKREYMEDLLGSATSENDTYDLV